MESWDFKVHCASVTLVSEVLDNVMFEVQRMDEMGSALLDICRPKSSPFVVALRKFEAMIVEGRWQGRLKLLFNHFLPRGEVAGREGDDDFLRATTDMPRQLRKLILTMTAQTWWRFVPLFRCWPYLFVMIIDPLQPLDVRIGLCEALFNAPECDLDVFFSLKVRRFYGSAARMTADSHFF